MADEELQRSTLRGGDAQLGDGPAQGGGIEHGGAAGGGRQDAGDDEISGHGLVDDDVGGTSLEILAASSAKSSSSSAASGVTATWLAVGVGGPVVESIDIHPVRAQQADAVDDDALGPGGGCDGAGGAPAVVFPSVNMTMTLSLLELGSKRAMALEKASAWLVLPPAERESTAFFRCGYRGDQLGSVRPCRQS